jgi:hypothetical protein
LRPEAEENPSDFSSNACPQFDSKRFSVANPDLWVQRLKRAFAIVLETCPCTRGKLRVIACIEDLPLIAKILAHAQRHDALTGRARTGRRKAFMNC